MSIQVSVDNVVFMIDTFDPGEAASEVTKILTEHAYDWGQVIA